MTNLLLKLVHQSVPNLDTYDHSMKVLSWYLTSVKSKDKELATVIESKDKELASKDKLIESKSSEIATLNTVIDHISHERRDVITALKDVVRRDMATDRKWSVCRLSSYMVCLIFHPGTVTRSDAWKALVDCNGVGKVRDLGEQQHPRKGDLETTFGAISTAKWGEEIDMYPDIFTALRSAFYNEGSSPDWQQLATSLPKVVDTHEKGDLRADGCVEAIVFNGDKGTFWRPYPRCNGLRRQHTCKVVSTSTPSTTALVVRARLCSVRHHLE